MVDAEGEVAAVFVVADEGAYAAFCVNNFAALADLACALIEGTCGAEEVERLQGILEDFQTFTGGGNA